VGDGRLVVSRVIADPLLERAELGTEILNDPALAADWAERLDRPLRQLKEERLRSALRAGELPADLDLELAQDMIWGPLSNRWAQRTGPLTPEYADALVEAALGGLRVRE